MTTVALIGLDQGTVALPASWRVRHFPDGDAADRAQVYLRADFALVGDNGDEHVPPLALGGTEHVLVSSEASLSRHLAACRAGYSVVLPPERVGGHLIEAVARRALTQREEPYRILGVGLDDQVRSTCACAFDRAGYQWHILHDAESLMTVLAEMSPDVLVLADHLGHATAQDAVRVVRRLPDHHRLPALIIGSARNRREPLPPNVTWLSKPLEFQLLGTAIQAAAEYSRRLADLMDRDSLTGLLNRRSFLSRLIMEVARAQRGSHPLSLALLDLDSFKAVNDRHGHFAGDRVLRRLGAFLSERLRAMDTAGRYGGEEFAIILSDTDVVAAARRLDALRLEFGRIPFETEEGTIHVTFSAGVAGHGSHVSPDQLVDDADAALFTAKRHGRNRIERADFEPHGA